MKPKLTDEQRFKNFVDSFVKYTLRRSSLRWKYRSEAFKRARIERGIYKCEMCGLEKRAKEVQLDHIVPVVPISGFTTWDDYIYRLFVPASGFQVICEICHSAKTMVETGMRVSSRNKLTTSKKKIKIEE